MYLLSPINKILFLLWIETMHNKLKLTLKTLVAFLMSNDPFKPTYTIKVDKTVNTTTTPLVLLEVGKMFIDQDKYVWSITARQDGVFKAWCSAKLDQGRFSISGQNLDGGTKLVREFTP